MTVVAFRRSAAWLRTGQRLVLSGPLVASLAFLIYLKTLAPGILGFDSAEFTTGAYTLGIVHPPGYPLYLLIAKAFTYLPLSNVAYRINLMSAVFGALTVFLVYRLAKRLTARSDVAFAAGALVAVTNYFWQMALVAEVYTLHTFFLALDLLLLFAWRSSGNMRFLWVFAITYGLSLANHTSGILFAIGYAWLIVSSPHWHWRDWRKYAGLAGLFLLGLAPYLYFPLRAAANPPLNFAAYYGIDLTTPYGMWWMMSGQAWFFTFGYEWPEVLGEFAKFFGYLWRNFLGVGVLLGAIGLASLWGRKRTIAIGLLLLFAANVVFFANYRVVDKDTMFLPAYLIWALWLAEGLRAGHVWTSRMVGGGRLHSAAKTSVGVLFLSIAPVVLIFNWRWVDMSNHHGPRLFAEQVLNTAEPDALIMAQWSSAAVLEYFQVVEGQRPDLIVYDRSRHGLARLYKMQQAGVPAAEIYHTISNEERGVVDWEILQRTVYVIEYDPRIPGEYQYLPQGDYFKLVPRAAADDSY